MLRPLDAQMHGGRLQSSFVGRRKPVNTGTYGLIRIMYTGLETPYRCAYMTWNWYRRNLWLPLCSSLLAEPPDKQAHLMCLPVSVLHW